MSRYVGYITAPLTLLSVVACTNTGAESSRTPTVDLELTYAAATEASPTVGYEPTVTAQSTVGPTATMRLTPTAAPTPAFPFETQPDFLFGGESDDCELPCWHGLRIHESSEQDIQHAFDTVLGFNGALNPLFPADRRPWEDLIGWGYGWRMPYNSDDSDLLGGFDIEAWISQDERLLEGLNFHWGTEAISSLYSPKRILQELGVPSAVLMSLSITETETFFVRLLIIYNQGSAFYFLFGAPLLKHTTDGQIDSIIAEVCLGGEPWSSAGFAYIMPPIEHSLPEDVEKLEPLQYRFIGDWIEGHDLRLLSEFFDLNLEELTSVALAPGDSCIQSVNLYHRD